MGKNAAVEARGCLWADKMGYLSEMVVWAGYVAVVMNTST
jgi:hypothetical protein